MFRGANSINLDSKGRLAIPAKYRSGIIESAQSHMIITCDPYENCLLIFTLQHWEATEADLRALSNSKPLYRKLKRIMLANASEVDMDSSGRLLIPGLLREIACLNKESMLIGQGEIFQLWNETQWNNQMQEDLATLRSDELDPDDLPDLFY